MTSKDIRTIAKQIDGGYWTIRLYGKEKVSAYICWCSLVKKCGGCGWESAQQDIVYRGVVDV